MDLNIGDKAPEFTLPKDGGGFISLKDFLGKKVILYFYPKDRTPGCTIEACAFRDAKEQFDQKDIVIIGISRDSVESHDHFKQKYGLNFLLVADETGEVCDQYGVLNKKPLLGIKLFELERATFLIDEKGQIAQAWRNVNSLTHVKKVLKTL